MTSNQVKMQSSPCNWETPQTLEILVTGAVDALCALCLGLRALNKSRDRNQSASAGTDQRGRTLICMTCRNITIKR